MKRIIFTLFVSFLFCEGFSQTATPTVVNYDFEASPQDLNPANKTYTSTTADISSQTQDGIFLPGIFTKSAYGTTNFFVKAGTTDGSVSLVPNTTSQFFSPSGNTQSLQLNPSSAAAYSNGTIFGIYNFSPGALNPATQNQIVGITFTLKINGTAGSSNFILATGYDVSTAEFFTGTLPFYIDVAVNGTSRTLTTNAVSDKNGGGNSPNNLISSSTTTFLINNATKVEIYFNNSSTDQSFLRNNTTELLQGKSVLLYINNTRYYQQDNNSNSGTTLNSFMISGYNKSSGANDISAFVDNLVFGNGNVLAQVAGQTAALPSLLSDFSAKPVVDHTSLTWSTTSEISNKGFRIERQSDDFAGKFQQIGFVDSKALEGGNSQTSLSYSFIDNAPKLGAVNAYRLVQEDLNGKLTYSEIKSVKLGAQGVTSIYPNPSNGNVTISRTGSNNKMNIQVIDQSGRIINQINGITDPNYKLTNLRSGMYTIKLTYPQTGEQSIQKVLVQK